LILEDPQGEPQRLELKKFFQPGDAGARLFLPLPVGATFSFPVDLRDYRAVASKKSFTGVPLSASRNTAMICSSVNLLFMRLLLSLSYTRRS
jgi:hypothetical protein